MAAEELSGFPEGSITFTSHDEEFKRRLMQITSGLLSKEIEGLPVTYEERRLALTAPQGTESDDIGYQLDWPITQDQYNNFLHPQIPEVKPAESIATPEPTPDALDIFKSKPSENERTDEQIADQIHAAIAARKVRERALLVSKMDVVHAVLNGIPEDPLIQKYVDSFGIEYDTDKGEGIPLGINVEGIDRNIYYRINDKFHAILASRISSSSSGSIQSATAHRVSLANGQEYNSDKDRDRWEASLRGDLEILLDKLRETPDYYVHEFEEKGILLSTSMEHSNRRIGTTATKEFFEGYQQFADAGITVLKAKRTSNWGGTSSYGNTDYVARVDAIDLALKHSLEGRPHQVRLESGGDVNYSRVYVYSFPEPLDGSWYGPSRIGGYYGELDDDPEGSVNRMREKMRKQIGEEKLARIRAGQPIGTEFTQFSHNDFYDIIAHLSELAL